MSHPHPTNEAALRQELVRFWRQLGLLASSGVPILQALKIHELECREAKVREAIAAMAESIRRGRKLSDALAESPGLFSASVVALCRAGEVGGVVDTVAERIAKGLENGALDVGGEDDAAVEAAPVEAAPDGLPIFQRIIMDAAKARASDIHVEPTESGGQVRLRIDGAMAAPEPLDRPSFDALIAHIALMANMDIAEKRRPQDGRICLNIEGRDVDLRVSCCSYIHGYSAVLRVLDRRLVHIGLADVVLDEKTRDEFQRWAREPNGIFVASGPTGSGKTTLLYAIIKEAATPQRKVMAAEEPVEYLIEGVLQAQLQTRLGVTFPALMRSFLRQDPDVIMVGEVRDSETLQICIQAALTGHAVFTTLHTATATDVPRRMVDIGAPGWLVRDSLRGVSSMRLVRRVCANCAKPYRPDDLDKLAGLPDGEALAKAEFVRGEGCEKCRRTGFRGRIGVYETLPMTPSVLEAVAANVPPGELRLLAKAEGMATLFNDAARHAADGLTTLEEAVRVTYAME